MEVAIAICPVCSMRIEEGRGVVKDSRTFCCEGCASGTDCTCPDEM
jgi:hypothetical protein